MEKLQLQYQTFHFYVNLIQIFTLLHLRHQTFQKLACEFQADGFHHISYQLTRKIDNFDQLNNGNLVKIIN